MTLTLYTTSSEKNRIGKALNQQIQITGTLRASDRGNMRNPVITVETTASNNATVLSCNYAYITEFGKYYFIGDKRTVSDKLVELPLTCDVLESFSASILNTKAVIARSEGYNSPYLNDISRPIYNWPAVLTKTFSTGFDSPHYYLTVASSVEST